MKKLVLAMFLGMHGVGAYANGDGVGTSVAPTAKSPLSEAELKTVQQEMKASPFLSVDFTQGRYSALRKKTRKSQGRARFAQPDKFRWQLESPVPEQWIYDGTELLSYNPETKSAIRYSASGSTSKQLKQIVDFVLNFDSLLSGYKVDSATKDGDIVAINLTPKQDNEVTAVELKIDRSKSYVSYLKLDYAGGNYTELLFSNPLRNTISADTFKAPAGVKITDSI